MTDATADEQVEDAAAKLRSKNGVPKADLATIDSQAQKIWAAARRGEIAPVLVARALTGKDDSKASGGTWATRIGALRLYNVVEKGSGNNFKLTNLGIALSNTADSEGHARALKDAILGVPAYARVLGRYDGGSLPDVGIIASDYEYTYELSKSDAAAAAKLFVESAKYAALVSEEGAVNLGGLVAPSREEDLPLASTENAGPPTVAPPTPSAQSPAAPAVPSTIHVPAAHATPGSPSPLGTAPVAITVKLDMSEWDVKDVLSVLSALGYENARHESE
jgi:hypothetical protein